MPRHPIPAGALHAHYATTGGHADCYAADIAAPVSLAAFVHAFYTSDYGDSALIAPDYAGLR